MTYVDIFHLKQASLVADSILTIYTVPVRYRYRTHILLIPSSLHTLFLFFIISSSFCSIFGTISNLTISWSLQAVRAIGRCAIKLDQGAERCINVLLDLIQTKVSSEIDSPIVTF